MPPIISSNKIPNVPDIFFKLLNPIFEMSINLNNKNIIHVNKEAVVPGAYLNFRIGYNSENFISKSI